MKPAYIFALLFMLSVQANAQENTWKKDVSRIIDTRSNYVRHRKSDSSIAEVLANAVKKKNIIVYSALDADFAARMRSDAIPYLFNNCIAPGAERSIKNYDRFLKDSLYQFRIYEEWSFDKVKDVRIVIRYVAPVRNAYDEYGRYRGKQALFLVHADDFLNLIKQHPKLKQQFSQSFWNSHFEHQDQKKSGIIYDQATGKWIAKAVTKLPVTQKIDVPSNFLRNEHEDSTLISLIEHEVSNGNIPAWTNSNMLGDKQMTRHAVNELIYPWADTIVTVDPVTGNEIVQYMLRSSLDRISHYYILLNWTFDPATGTTNITFTALAPCDANYGSVLGISGPIFWVQYTKVLHLINKLEQYQPEHSFSLQLWNSFFISDKKPELL